MKVEVVEEDIMAVLKSLAILRGRSSEYDRCSLFAAESMIIGLAHALEALHSAELDFTTEEPQSESTHEDEGTSYQVANVDLERVDL